MPAQVTVLSSPKQQEYIDLYRQFADEYFDSTPAQDYLVAYSQLRARAAKNYQTALSAFASGLDITDTVLLTLLPYSDTVNNRWRGAWIHVAPAITGDIRHWYEAAGWTRPQDWPRIAESILTLVQRCVDWPDQLADACTEFSDLPYSKGFQSGTLSPILNALRPQDFHVVNSRTRSALNYFAETDFDHTLRNYPAANRALHSLLLQVASLHEHSNGPIAQQGDIFDLFAYWLTTIKDFPFRTVRYWRLDVGNDLWQWRDWMDEGYIAIGWDELGDLSEITRAEYVQRRDSLMMQMVGWNKRSVDQAWRFRRDLNEGDRIIITHVGGQDDPALLGTGTIIGSYTFTPHVSMGHRMPVHWDDLTLRQIPSQFDVSNWSQDLSELDASQFETLLRSPLLTLSLAQLFATESSETKNAPDFLRFCIPIIEYLTSAGGHAAADDVVASIVSASTKDDRCAPETHTQRKISERIHRARRYLEKANLIKLQRNGQWILTRKGADVEITPARVIDIFAEVEYRRRLAGTLADESPHIRRLAETAAASESYAPEVSQPNVEARVDAVERYEPDAFEETAGYAADVLEQWVRAINRKGQAILYGPPGTGKTFLASHIARHLAAGGDGFVETVQFHPAYSYEEFVQGIRPHSTGDSTTFPLMPGRFLQFCKRAATCNDCCVLIIDEINRADLAQVFGELMHLLEYRGKAIILAGSDEPFAIPENVRIIGTMNTADRSIALLDNALRRRFAFIEIEPNYTILRDFHVRRMTGFSVDALIAVLHHINQMIGDKHFALGISFFLRTDLHQEIADIWQMEIEPYLTEYFIDQPQIMENLRWSSVGPQLDKTS